MNQLAYALHDEGKLPEAEQYARQSLATLRRVEGEEHPDIAVGLNHLATVLKDEGKLDQAEPMLRQAFAVEEHAWGPCAPRRTGSGGYGENRNELRRSSRQTRQASGKCAIVSRKPARPREDPSQQPSRYF